MKHTIAILIIITAVGRCYSADHVIATANIGATQFGGVFGEMYRSPVSATGSLGVLYTSNRHVFYGVSGGYSSLKADSLPNYSLYDLAPCVFIPFLRDGVIQPYIMTSVGVTYMVNESLPPNNPEEQASSKYSNQLRLNTTARLGVLVPVSERLSINVSGGLAWLPYSHSELINTSLTVGVNYQLR